MLAGRQKVLKTKDTATCMDLTRIKDVLTFKPLDPARLAGHRRPD